MLINPLKFVKNHKWEIALIGTCFLFQQQSYAQTTPIETIQKIYSFYQPQPNDRIDVGFDRTDKKNNQFFSPDFLRLIQEDNQLTSAQGDASIIDYDFICNCQDTMDGLVVRNIQILHQTDKTARIKVSFDFIINGSDSFQKDDVFTNDHPGQQHTYFNLIKYNNQWLIDDVTNAQNIGIKNNWKKELHKYYHSSIQ